MAKRVNWDYIEPLWRSSKMSNVEITRQYTEVHRSSKEWKRTVTETAIRKRARLKRWTKDLIPAVRKKTREKLVRASAVRGEVRGADKLEPNDDEIVEAASGALAEVVQTIQADALKTRKLLEEVRDEILEDPMQIRLFAYRGMVTEHEVKMGTEERTRAIRNLVQSERAWVETIWKVFGLEESEGEEYDGLEFNMYLAGGPPDNE